MDSSKESEIASIRRRADRSAHGHIAQALRLQLLDDIATWITTIGGATMMAIGAALLGSDNPQRLLEVAVATVGGVVTLVSVWQAVWQPGARSRRHKSWAVRFTQIEDECRLLAFGEGSKTIKDLMREILEVQNDADLVAEGFWRRKASNAQHNET